MSFLLMNLFSAPAQAAPLSGGNAVKGDGQPAQSGANGAAFSAMLSAAKERLAPTTSASATALSTQPIDAATMQAIKQPADALAALKDLALTDQQLTDLRAALRDVLDSENFAGDEQTEQAFQELHDQLETDTGNDAGGVDVVDLDAVVIQLPAVVAAAQQPRSEMLVRIAQFIQSTLSGQGNAAHGKTDQPAQLAHHAANRTDPLLEVVQASMFPAEALATSQTQTSSQQTQISNVATQVSQALAATGTAVAAAETKDDLPQWVRDISPAPKAQAASDEGDLYKGMALPEVSLPGSDDATSAQDAEPENTQATTPQGTPHVTVPAVAAAIPSQTQTVAQPVSEPAHAVSKQQAALQAGVAVTQTAAAKPAAGEADAENTSAQDAPEPTASARNANAATPSKPPKFASMLEAASAKSQPTAREHLSALPEQGTKDVVLEAVRTDVAPQSSAPTHQDKIVATQAQRAADASLYHHRTQVVEQVHVAIARASKADIDRITIQLDPADLGRVDVVMDVRRDGATQLMVTADRRETLDMLQRDARSLERALQEAGIKADAGSMEFNLRQQPNQNAAFNGQQGFGQNPNQSQHAATQQGNGAANGETIIQPEIISSATYTVNGGLNVIV